MFIKAEKYNWVVLVCGTMGDTKVVHLEGKV